MEISFKGNAHIETQKNGHHSALIGPEGRVSFVPASNWTAVRVSTFTFFN
jgi:hypothetical protein